MDPTDQRPPKRIIFEQGGPEQKKLSTFDQKLFSRSPPTPSPRIPISKSAPVSPIEEGAGSFGRDPPSSESIEGTSANIGQENAPDALGISGLNLQKLDAFNIDVDNSKLPTGEDGGDTGKIEEPRASPPPRVTVEKDIFAIPQEFVTSTKNKSTRVELLVKDGRPRLLHPIEFDLGWARDFLLPIDLHGRVPVLTESFDFAENVKFIPMTKPYAERLDKPYYSPSPYYIADYDYFSEPFLLGFPFSDGYPNADNISLRHVILRQIIHNYRRKRFENMTKAQQQALARSQAQQNPGQITVMNAPHPNHHFEFPKRSQQPNSSVIQSNMQFLLDDSSPVSDKNFAAFHYAPGQQAKLKKMQENLLSTNSDQGNNIKRHYPTHNMPQFLHQPAEPAAAAERHGEVPPADKFTYVDYDEMGDKTVTVKTKEQAYIDYHTLLKKDNQTWEDVFSLQELELDHDFKKCKYCSQSKPSFGIDAPNPTWTTDASKKPIPREGEPDLLFGRGEEDWEAAFIDYGDESQYSGVQDMDIDQLMGGN